MTITDQTLHAELVARIASREGTIKMWSSATNRPPGFEVSARTDIGSCWFDIAVCQMLLGDASAARDAFARAAESMLSAVEVMSPPAPYTYSPALATYSAALESAVLSGDRAMAAHIAASVVDPSPRPSLTLDRLPWALALPFLVMGDDAKAKIQADAASAVSEQKAWYPGLGDAIGALASNNKTSLASALERVLAKHVRYAQAKKSWCYNSGPCLLCVPAAALIRIAGWRGMDVSEIKARRAIIPLSLSYSVPINTLKIEVDFLAEVLIKR